jgi:hypothetical protein
MQTFCTVLDATFEQMLLPAEPLTHQIQVFANVVI